MAGVTHCVCVCVLVVVRGYVCVYVLVVVHGYVSACLCGCVFFKVPVQMFAERLNVISMTDL